jgi:hypothetical protein
LADPLIPSWLPDDHPFYVSAPTAERVRRGFRPNRIFLNIPYTSRYSNPEVAVLSTATAEKGTDSIFCFLEKGTSPFFELYPAV